MLVLTWCLPFKLGQTDDTVAKTGPVVNRSFSFLCHLYEDHDTQTALAPGPPYGSLNSKEQP
jgi:hypothetical protein